MTLYGIQAIPLHLIDANPWQTRQNEDEQHIRELAKSILEEGLLQIPIGRRLEGEDQDRVQLAFGHSRLAAFKLLAEQGNEEFSTFPVNLKIEITDEHMAVLAFTENEKRKDLNPVERAIAISNLVRDFNWTQQQIADKLKIDRSTVSNNLRLLGLPDEVLDALRNGILPARTAMALLPFYELTPLEISVLERERPDYADFIRLARSGQLNSDTVRITIDAWMKILHPEPAELPLLPENQGLTALPGTDQSGEPRTAESDGIEKVALEGSILVDSSDEEEVEEETVSETPRSTPVDRSGEVKPAPKPLSQETRSGVQRPQPAPAPEKREPEPVVLSTDTTLSITWDGSDRVMIWFKKPGEKSPQFIFRTSLKAAEFPEFLSALGIE